MPWDRHVRYGGSYGSPRKATQDRIEAGEGVGYVTVGSTRIHVIRYSVS